MTHDEQLKILLWNAHSMKNKVLELKTCLVNKSTSLLCIGDLGKRGFFLPKCVNYRVFLINRDRREGGGI